LTGKQSRIHQIFLSLKTNHLTRMIYSGPPARTLPRVTFESGTKVSPPTWFCRPDILTFSVGLPEEQFPQIGFLCSENVMATQKQIEANRRNARKSTGPRTPEGKAAMRLNALRHGLCARTVVLPGENEEEFHQLCADLESAWQPQDRTEQILVGKWSWRTGNWPPGIRRERHVPAN
jgi:hypothetical protein